MFFPPQPFSLAFLVLSLLFYGCGKQERTPDELIFSLSSDPISLDPIQSTDLSSRIALKYLYPNLFLLDDNGRILPALAKGFRVIGNSGDRNRILEIRLEVRKDSQGNPIDAGVVLSSLDRLRNSSGPKRSSYSFLKGGTAPDPMTVRLVFEGGLREALEKLSLPQASIYCGPPEKGCGSYALVEWKRNNFIRLRANENQSGAVSPFLLFRVLPQATTGIFLYAKGQLDQMRLPNFLLRNKNVKEESVLVRKGGGVQYVAINAKQPCFDKNFRKALNYAVDKRKILDVLLEGEAEVAVGPFPQSVAEGFAEKGIAEPYPYDPNLATEFLKKSSCYPEILSKELDFRMRGDEENQANGAAIVRYLRDLGLKVRIHPMEKASLYKENGEGRGDLTLLFWYADFPGAWNFVDPLFAGDRFGNAGNRSFYKSAAMESLLRRSRTTDSLDGRGLEKESLGILSEDAPWIFLWSPYELHLIAERLKSGSILPHSF